MIRFNNLKWSDIIIISPIEHSQIEKNRDILFVRATIIM